MADKVSNNSKVILFLGAGASAGLGFPPTAQFIDGLGWPGLKTMLNTYKEYRWETEGIAKKEIPVDSEYLRDWLYRMGQSARTIETISETPPFKPSVQKVNNANQLIQEILGGLDERIRSVYAADVSPDKAYQHYALLFEILKGNGVQSIPVFTTNYDLVFESMIDCNACEWKIETGMKPTAKRLVLDTSCFDHWPTTLPSIALFKLHGSTNWWAPPNRSRIEQIPTNYGAPHDYLEMLLYPTREKFSEVGNPPFAFLYGKLDDYLASRETKLCIAVGYSFRDKPINERFSKALKRGMQLLVYDRTLNAEQLGLQFLDFGITEEAISDRVRIENIPFGEWGLAQNRDEFRRTLVEAIRHINN